ncbi:hypothetical protein [Povalibacter sp.]|uniref:hypothetical protein n=1 Tax=Povalibacter sp. TaxID=1962978 RepID=UPI002F41B2CE
MADDNIEILGKWNVSFGPYKWEYVFTSDGVVRWRDPFNNESGAGRWSVTPKTIYLSWQKSSSKESWSRPVKRSGQSGWIEASYRTGALSAEKVDALALPNTSGGASEIDLELDPATGEYVQASPESHRKYIERVFTAVAYGVFPDGYYVYCEGMDLPIQVTESVVDFSLGTAERERSKIFASYAEAKQAAADSPSRRRIGYFWGAGSAVISPTVIGPATTPELYSTIIAVRGLHDKFVEVMMPAICHAIALIGGPSPLTVKGKQGTGRVAKRRGGNEPPRAMTGPKAMPVVTRPRATRQQLPSVVLNPKDYLTFRTRDPNVASGQPLVFTGQTNQNAQPDVHACYGKGNDGYGPYGVTFKASEVSARPLPGRAEEFHIVSPIEAGDGMWWHVSDLAGIKK